MNTNMTHKDFITKITSEGFIPGVPPKKYVKCIGIGK